MPIPHKNKHYTMLQGHSFNCVSNIWRLVLKSIEVLWNFIEDIDFNHVLIMCFSYYTRNWPCRYVCLCLVVVPCLCPFMYLLTSIGVLLLTYTIKKLFKLHILYVSWLGFCTFLLWRCYSLCYYQHNGSLAPPPF